MKIYDLLDPRLLNEMLDEGMVRKQYHPTEPLAILNYTERATYSKTWNEVTLQCRGLIFNTETQDIVARPFSKFFNYGEHPEGAFDLDAEVIVTDKMDGSLAILYWEPNSGLPAIATRGSFASPQAKWATAWFRKYADYAFFKRERTYLFELLVGWNRIVLEYDWEGLVLLGILDTETGHDFDLPEDPRLLQARTARDDTGEHQS